MASITNVIPNELNKMKWMSCTDQYMEEAQPTTFVEMFSSMICLNDEHQEEEHEQDEYTRSEEDHILFYTMELKLLDVALVPPPCFTNLHPDRQQELLSSFTTPTTTNDGGGYIDHSLVADHAVHELSTLALDKDGLFWTNDGSILNQQHYQQTFPNNPTLAPTTNSWTHASRAFAVVNMGHTDLVERLTTYYQWAKLFPSIVSEAVSARYLVKGSSYRNPDGSLQLIYAKLQATHPFLPKKTFVFLRTCKLIDHQTWVVADIPIDRSRNVGFPSGCLIRGMACGFSQVIWVEHLEVEENYLDRNLYTDLTCRGFAYGAERWVSCLERSCERRSYRTKTDISAPCLLGQEDPWLDEKKSVMKLSQRMVRQFCSIISFRNIEQRLWSRIPGSQNIMVYSDLLQSPCHKNLKEKVISSATTFTLPYPPDFVFEILGNEYYRHEWDASGRIRPYTKPTCYTTGNDPRNKIYVYQIRQGTENEVVLQEASVNRSGSLLVWSVLKSDELDLVLGGRGHRLPLVRLSGLAISSNNHQNTTSSSNIGGGSIVTLGAQHEVHDIKEIEPKMLDFYHNFIREAVSRIEGFLDKAAGRTVS